MALQYKTENHSDFLTTSWVVQHSSFLSCLDIYHCFKAPNFDYFLFTDTRSLGNDFCLKILWAVTFEQLRILENSSIVTKRSSLDLSSSNCSLFNISFNFSIFKSKSLLMLIFMVLHLLEKYFFKNQLTFVNNYIIMLTKVKIKQSNNVERRNFI